MNTAEASQKSGIAKDKLMRMQREGKLNPSTTGEGTQKRIDWSDDDIALAKRLETDYRSADEILLDELGGDSFRAVLRRVINSRKRYRGQDTICTVIGERGAKDCTHNDVVAKVLIHVGDVAVMFK